MRAAFLFLGVGLAVIVAGGAARGAPPVRGGQIPFRATAGYGVIFAGPAPANSGRVSCALRWNAPRNVTARTQAVGASGKLRGAFVRVGAKDDYWEAPGRCLIYVVGRLVGGVQATVFVETKTGVFTRIGYASQQRSPVESRISQRGIISFR